MEVSVHRRNGQLVWLTIASIVATAPVWIPHYPMMVDLSQHAAEIALLRDLQDPGFRFSELFKHHWFTPYWAGYGLAYLLTPLVGIRIALKLVVSLALASFPVTTEFAIREMQGDSWWAWLSIPAMFGFACQWGLLNFLVAVPVGLLFLGFVARYTRLPSRANSWLLALSAAVLFFCHALICAIFGLIAVLYIFSESDSIKAAVPKMVPLLAPIPLALLYWNRSITNPVSSSTLITVWDIGWFRTTEFYYSLLSPFGDGVNGGWGRINGFFPRLLGIRPSLSCTLEGLFLFSIPLVAGARLRRRIAVWIPLIVLAIVLLFLPSLFLGNAYTFERFTLLAMPFFALIWSPQDRPRARQRIARLATVALGVTSVVIFAFQMTVFTTEQAGFLRILDEMTPKERVLGLMLDRESNVAIAPPFLHFAAWYGAEKGGLVDPSFAFMGIEPVLFRKGSAPPATTSGFEWYPGKFKWDVYRGNSYRYFVVRFRVDAGPVLFRGAPCPIELVDHMGEWWLYEKSAACASAEPAVSELKQGGSRSDTSLEDRHAN